MKNAIRQPKVSSWSWLSTLVSSTPSSDAASSAEPVEM